MYALVNQKQNLAPFGRCTIRPKPDAKIRSLNDECYVDFWNGNSDRGLTLKKHDDPLIRAASMTS